MQSATPGSPVSGVRGASVIPSSRCVQRVSVKSGRREGRLERHGFEGSLDAGVGLRSEGVCGRVRRASMVWVIGLVLLQCAVGAAGPPSTKHSVLSQDAIEHFSLPSVDLGQILDQDADAASRTPFRVAVPQAVGLDLEILSTRESLGSHGVLFRVVITSPGALFQSVKFSRFHLPPGAELYFVSCDYAYEDGPYTQSHNRAPQRFGSPMIPGASAVVELLLRDPNVEFDLEIESVSYGYRDVMGMDSFPARDGTTPPAGANPFGGPLDCHRDVNCPEGAPYQAVKQAMAEGYDGTSVCSGQLMNNTLQDGAYLYLTAEHCGWWQDAAAMVYYWNYENSTCGGSDAPLTFSTGSTSLFHTTSATQDLNLLLLDGVDLEGQFGVYFAGWNRTGVVPTMGSILSFPADNPLQITIDQDSPVDCASGLCPGGYGPQFWRVEDWEVGTTLGGSSGGGLLDQDQLVVGVLAGGVGTNCNDFDWDEFFKISAVWTQLQPYLDPVGSNPSSLSGWDGSSGGGFRRGDSNGDGGFDIGDPVFTLALLFSMGPAVSCDDAADANDDGSINIGDPTFSLAAIFGTGPTLPWMSCLPDATVDALGCVTASCP